MASGHFSNFFYDNGDDIGIKFVRADATKISPLLEFRDSCQPHFVFYLGGDCVGKVVGADIVKIRQMIFEKAPKL